MKTDKCMIFEGFMDYLSHLTINKRLQPQMDTLVLNSIIHLKSAMNFLYRHRLIYTCLDNDPAGKKILAEISRMHGNVVDLSIQYEPYKDLNEHLVNQLIINN